VFGSFWGVDKIQNGVTMETEVPKFLISIRKSKNRQHNDLKKKDKRTIKQAMIIFVFFNFLAFWPFPWQRQPF
jgi:hypothetical protein